MKANEVKMTRDEHLRAEGALNALDIAGPRIMELKGQAAEQSHAASQLADAVLRLEAQNRALREALEAVLELDHEDCTGTEFEESCPACPAMKKARAALAQTMPEPLNNTIRGETHSSRTEAPNTQTKVPDT